MRWLTEDCSGRASHAAESCYVSQTKGNRVELIIDMAEGRDEVFTIMERIGNQSAIAQKTYAKTDARRNLSTTMRQRSFEFSEPPRRRTTSAWVG